MRPIKVLRIIVLIIPAIFFYIGFWLGEMHYKVETPEVSIRVEKCLLKDEPVIDKKMKEEINLAKFARESKMFAVKNHRCCQKRLSEKNLTKSQLNIVHSHIIVDRKNKLLYCYVPKVASSNMKRLILTLQGKSDSADAIKQFDQRGFDFLGDFDKTEREHMMNTYFKFLFVRDPFFRIVSTYKNKFFLKATEFRLSHGKKIIQLFRSNGSSKVSGLGTNVPTFQEFIRYLIHEKSETMNEHWQPYNDLCQPCLISYDFIGSFENIDIDADELLRTIKAPKDVTFPKRQSYYKPAITGKEIRKFYSGITAAEYRALRQKYNKDLLCFSYATLTMKTHILKR